MALAFLAFAALVVVATLHLAFASSATSASLKTQRDNVYAADGATDAAIQLGRVDKTVGAYVDPRCHSTDPTTATGVILLTTTINAKTASVICTYSSDPLQLDRTVTFTTFVSGVASPVVQATVIYHDTTAGSGNAAVFVNSWTYCGHSTSC